jgi:hypothetical protein
VQGAVREADGLGWWRRRWKWHANAHANLLRTPATLTASMIEAWLSWSLTTMSSLPMIVCTAEALAATRPPREAVTRPLNQNCFTRTDVSQGHPSPANTRYGVRACRTVGARERHGRLGALSSNPTHSRPLVIIATAVCWSRTHARMAHRKRPAPTSATTTTTTAATHKRRPPEYLEVRDLLLELHVQRVRPR